MLLRRIVIATNQGVASLESQIALRAVGEDAGVCGPGVGRREADGVELEGVSDETAAGQLLPLLCP